MNSEQILMYVVALILGMLLANMLKGVCGCKVVEGQDIPICTPEQAGICNCPSFRGEGWQLAAGVSASVDCLTDGFRCRCG